MSDRDGPGERGEGDARDAPLADLAERARQRRDSDEDGEADAFAAFERMDGREIDDGAIWERVADGDDDEAVAVDERPAADDEGDRDVQVVPSSTCHGCRYLGAPPELHCTHEGTEIRELTEPERYTVVDCPMVMDAEDVGGVED